MKKKELNLIRLRDFLLAFDKENTIVEIYEGSIKNENMFVRVIENRVLEDILKNRKLNPYYVINGKTQIWDENGNGSTLMVHVARKQYFEKEMKE